MHGESQALLHWIRQPQRGRKLLNLLVSNALLFALLPAQPGVSQTIQANRNGAGRTLQTPAETSVNAGEVKAQIRLSKARALSGQPLGVVADFDIRTGWHVYGKPLPEEYTPASVTFDNELLSAQTLNFPKPTPVRFERLGDTLPVYQGSFTVQGNITLRGHLAPGEHKLRGTVGFQECNDNLCKMPQQVRFEIPIWIVSSAGKAG